MPEPLDLTSRSAESSKRQRVNLHLAPRQLLNGLRLLEHDTPLLARASRATGQTFRANLASSGYLYNSVVASSSPQSHLRNEE
jgi:hypothetical protein